MAVQPCHECGQPISTEAAACPHCGAPGLATQVRQEQTARAEKTANRGCLGCAGIFGVGALLFAVMIGVGASGDGESADAPHDRYMALAICQQAVERQLRAPGTADYPWDASENTVHLGAGKYRARTYVDAQNAFGGEVRTTFDCTVQWAGGDDWRVESLTLDP